MTKKELTQMCTSPIQPSEIQTLQNFLTRLKSQNATDIPSLVKKFLLTECIVFLFFAILTRRPSFELYLSILPFTLMSLAGYIIALIAVISSNTRTTRRMARALAQPENIRCTPDSYLYAGEKTKRTGNELSSHSIHSALFQKSSSSSGSFLCVSLRYEGLFFDTLKQGAPYKIYAVDEYICFVSQIIS